MAGMGMMNKGAAQRGRIAHDGRIGRGSKVGAATVMGIARDGTIIYQPALKPKRTTAAKIRAAVKAVKNERRADEQIAAG